MERRLYEIGERLTNARLESGYTQEILAEKMGCCVITISRWENGHRPMKTMDIIYATEALHISADYLLGTNKYQIRGMDQIHNLTEEHRKIVETVLEALLDALNLTKRLGD